MGDLVFSGTLNLGGSLELAASGGKVKVGRDEMLVQVANGVGPAHSTTATPVLLPPTSPIELGTKVWIVKSLNALVRVGGAPVVTSGMTLQGGQSSPAGIWPGMVLPNTKHGVRIDGVPINVKGDSAVTLPNGGTASLDNESGQ